MQRTVYQSRVVTGRDLVRAQRPRFVQESLELDLAVAQHVRIRRAPGAVFVEEMRKHAVPILRGEIARMERDAQLATNGDGVLAIGIGGTRCGAVVLLPVLHEQALHLVSGALQQQGSDG